MGLDVNVTVTTVHQYEDLSKLAKEIHSVGFEKFHPKTQMLNVMMALEEKSINISETVNPPTSCLVVLSTLQYQF